MKKLTLVLVIVVIMSASYGAYLLKEDQRAEEKDRQINELNQTVATLQSDLNTAKQQIQSQIVGPPAPQPEE